MARTKQTARKSEPSETVTKAPQKTGAKAGAKAGAKPAAKTTAKPATKPGPKKAPVKAAQKTQAKAPAKAKQVEASDYASMKVPQLKELLEERGLDTTGLKPVLIARLKAHDKKAPKPSKEVEEEEPEPEEEVEQEEETTEPEDQEAVDDAEEEQEAEEEVEEKPKKKPAPKAPPKKVPVKSKAPAKAPPKKVPVKPKVPAKAPAKPKVPPKPKAPAKKPKVREFPDISIPEVTYTIDAAGLSAIIFKLMADAQVENESKFFEDLYVAMDDYVVAEPDEKEEGEEKEEGDEGDEKEEGEEKEEGDEGEETGVDGEGDEKEEGEGEEGSEEKEKVAPPTEKVVEKPKMAVTYDEDFGAYLDPTRTYLIDPTTQSVYAKVNDGEVVELDQADLASLKRFRIYEDEKGILVGRPKGEFEAALHILLKSSKEHRDKMTGGAEEGRKVLVVPPPTGEGAEEGDDDGTEVELDGDEGGEGEELDVVEKVEEEEKELLDAKPQIDEATFSKFLQVQHSGEVKPTDYVSISKKAGIPVPTGEQIMLQYKLLSDKYPQAVVAAKMKKPQAKTSLVEKPVEKTGAPAAAGQRRLIKK